MKHRICCILTDIEGTTTSVSFVYDVLFPYFRNHIQDALTLEKSQLDSILEQTKSAAKEENIMLNSTQECLEQLIQWSLEDKKISPLKNLQGFIWEKGYRQGKIKGHIYPDVPEILEKWHKAGIKLAVYSSGSVKAQQLLFGNSEFGDLRSYFSAYFDTKIGHKREKESYKAIANQLGIDPAAILFLSDIEQELDAATLAGMNVIQLTRPGTEVSKKYTTADNFKEIII
jgi:enolase-phosphatase E1